MTPNEAWYKHKPDVSHLRVWGCTAYVFVQKDKCKSLAPHMEKCIFLGYPDGYKGWKFYNPTTKKVIISECAKFDEHYFPGLSCSGPASMPLLPLPVPVTHPVVVPVPVLDEDGDEDNHPTLPPLQPPAVPPPVASPPPSPQLPPVIH
jgi:hypothetical protein